MAAAKVKVEEALASIREKVDSLSGAGVDLTDEYAQILDAIGSKLDEPEVPEPPQPTPVEVLIAEEGGPASEKTEEKKPEQPKSPTNTGAQKTAAKKAAAKKTPTKSAAKKKPAKKGA